MTQNLVKVYGKRAFDVCDLATKNPGWQEQIIETQPYIIAEIFYSIKNEMATTVDDLVERRFKVRILDMAACEQMKARIQEILGNEHFLRKEDTEGGAVGVKKGVVEGVQET